MTAFDEEWVNLKRDAANQMQLAGAGDNSGGNAPGWVKSSKTAWNTAGDGVNSLRTGIRKALKDMETGERGTGAGGTVGGLESAAALRELSSTWVAYVEAVNRRCGELTEKLNNAGNHLYKNDAETEAAFEKTRTKVDTSNNEGGKGDNGSKNQDR